MFAVFLNDTRTSLTSFIWFQMPDELVSAYDWTSSLEKQMMENLHSGSQKVFDLKPDIF